MKSGYILTGIMFLLAGIPLYGQEKLEETLYVEGEYVPAIVRQDKIHLLPRKISFDMPVVNPSTEFGLVTGNYVPGYSILTAPVWQGEREAYRWKGYLTGAIGSYLNSNLSAGYRIVDTESSKGGVWLQHNSSSLFHPRMSESSRDRRRYRYDEQIGFDLRHDMGKRGILSGLVTYHLGLFNYYGATLSGELNSKAPTQTLNDAWLELHWQTSRGRNLQIGLRGHAGYFGYRRFYSEVDYVWESGTGLREIEAGVGASISGNLGSGHSLGADVDFTNVSYNKVVNKLESRSLQSVRVMPYYGYTGERFSARLGVVADAAWGAGKSLYGSLPELDYSTLHVAPHISLSYDGGSWGATVSATGGQQLQTLRRGYNLDYYQRPMRQYVMPAFVPVEGKGRLEYKGNGRFRAGVDVTYTVIRHLYMGGWYMSRLSGLSDEDYPARLHGNLSGFSIGLDAEWQVIREVTLRGRGTYQPQRNGSTTGFFNGYDRPRWTLDASVEVRPLRQLDFTVGYRYRGVRNIYSNYWDTAKGNATRLPDICNLNFGVRYRLNRTVSFFGTADNLLGKRVEILPCQPAEGFNFLVGADVVF